MTIDPFDPPEPVETTATTSESTPADKPSVFIKVVAPEILTKDEGPLSDAPTVRPPLSEGWLRIEAEVQSRPYVEYREDEMSDISVMADQDGIFISLGNGDIVAMNDKIRVERLIHALERAWDDHEFFSVLKENKK